jgi:penicillin-binding protein 2
LGSSTKIRFRLVIYFLIILITALVVRLYFLQVMSGEVYAQEASTSILREKNIPAPRGNIYDRNGKLLVRSIPSPAVMVDPRLVSKNEEVLDILSRKLNIRKSEILDKISQENLSYLDKVVLQYDIDYGALIYLKENAGNLPGVEVVDIFLREYEYGGVGAHVLGYTGEIDEQRLEMQQYSTGYEGGDQIGLTGVEETYEYILKGSKGKITYEVDPVGKPQNIVEEIPYVPGNDLFLTVDIDLQKTVEEILVNSIMEIRQQKPTNSEEFYSVPGGAVVVLDAINGEVLTMASYPTYDPSVFKGGISVSDWEFLNDPVNAFPLNNRALLAYAPGSVFKIVTAYGGLSEEVINTGRYVSCGGIWYGLGEDFPKWCWAKSGHGSLNIYGGIQNSCDIYFYQVGFDLFLKNSNSDELLQKYARIFGFGSKTGIDLPFEEDGIVPDKEWKKEYFKDQIGNSVWFPGDTVNMAIGQGDLLVTPLQMACAYSILLNRGLELTPHLGKEVRDPQGNIFIELNQEDPEDLQLDGKNIDIIEKGLELVVTSGTGAGRFIGFPLKEIPVAGKTGTAEVIGKQDYGWFVCYAPVENPEYIIVVMLEQSGGGSRSAAPIAVEILEYLYNLDN